MAEWAQLRGGPPNTTTLERGYWYPIESRMNIGLVRVMGPSAFVTPVHEDFLRIIDREPDFITRVLGTRPRPRQPGDPVQFFTFYGICPKGHKVENLTLSESNAHCSECGRDYQVENEEHISEASAT